MLPIPANRCFKSHRNFFEPKLARGVRNSCRGCRNPTGRATKKEFWGKRREAERPPCAGRRGFRPKRCQETEAEKRQNSNERATRIRIGFRGMVANANECREQHCPHTLRSAAVTSACELARIEFGTPSGGRTQAARCTDKKEREDRKLRKPQLGRDGSAWL
jgi:hypothetical protein